MPFNIRFLILYVTSACDATAPVTVLAYLLHAWFSPFVVRVTKSFSFKGKIKDVLVGLFDNMLEKRVLA